MRRKEVYSFVLSSQKMASRTSLERKRLALKNRSSILCNPNKGDYGPHVLRYFSSIWLFRGFYCIALLFLPRQPPSDG